MIKVVNKACQVLTALFTVAALVFFFFNFANLNNGGIFASGLQVSFGSEVAEGLTIEKSSHILFNFILTVLGAAMAILTFFSKAKGLKFFVAADSLAVAIYMLVAYLGDPMYFIDYRLVDAQGAVTKATAVAYTPFVLLLSIAMFAAFIFGVAYILVNDRIEVLASKGAKKSIIKRIVYFFKDYKSECKKIVWPGIKEVLKNTGIVLVMFLVFGAIVWLVDFGLKELLELIW